MEQYIKKSDIIAEIKRLISIANSQYDLVGNEDIRNRILWSQQASVCSQILSFLDTLEVKEINNVWNNASDFPKAEAGRSILLIEDNGHAELLKSPSAERLFYYRPTNLKMWAYVDELLSMATHFEVKDVDLDFQTFAKEMETVFSLLSSKTKNTEEEPLNWEYAIAKHFFELGLKAKEE